MESRVPHHIPGVSSSLISQPLLDGRTHYGHLPHPVTIYPLDQMKSLHVENDYIDSPAVVSQQPPGHKAGNRRITWLGQSQESFLGANHNHHHNHQNHQNHPHQDTTTTHPWISFSGRPSSISSSSSTSSDQRLLDHVAPTPTVDQHAHLHHHHHHHHHHHGSVNTVTTRTPGCLASSANPKVLTSASSSSSSSSASSSSKSLDVAPGKAAAPARGAGPPVSSLIPSSPAEKKHLLLCQQCGKCRCTECTLPRALPSCWVCNQGCLCSAQSLVDTATCMCLVKGVFYHCAEDEDEEGSCADKPCSCHGANCCSRWSFMAAVAMLLPCLVCYLPATGLAKLGQKCYDGVSRPGCRCKNPEGGVGGGGCKSDGVEAKVEALQGKQQQGW